MAAFENGTPKHDTILGLTSEKTPEFHRLLHVDDFMR